jgi:diguanylate cyclase (GGDEF)-like protein
MDMCNNHEQRIANEDCPVARAISTGVQWLGRVSVMGRQGRHVAVDLHAIPVRGNDGAVHGATLLLHDASSETSLEEKCQALHAQVAKDPMTQVANRAEFDRMLNNFVAAHQESNLPCSLIMSDIDHFKSINDTCGHTVGDEAIMAVAAARRSRLRNIDLFGRWGGEEFLALLDGSNAEGAWRVAEDLRATVEAIRLPNCPCPLTISIGIATTSDGRNPKVFDQMLSSADQQLYQAKKQGRNRVMPRAA